MHFLPGIEFSEAMSHIRFDGGAALPAALRGSVLLLGSFDGFHLGHRAVLEQGRGIARLTGMPLAVLQLDPHPRALFGGARDFRLISGAARDLLISQCGFDMVYAPRFDHAFAAIGAHDFASRILSDVLGVSAVVAGRDFRFGRGREGDASLLADLGRQHGYRAHIIPDVLGGGDRISSSRIRDAIGRGDLATAERMLGQPWTIGIHRGDTGWTTDADQVLPPPGDWRVEACNALGSPLADAVLHLGCDRSLRLAAPSRTRILRWQA